MMSIERVARRKSSLVVRSVDVVVESFEDTIMFSSRNEQASGAFGAKRGGIGVCGGGLWANLSSTSMLET